MSGKRLPALSRGAVMLAALGLPARSVASQVGCSHPAVLAWRGGRSVPGTGLRARLEDLFGIPVHAWSEPAHADTEVPVEVPDVEVPDTTLGQVPVEVPASTLVAASEHVAELRRELRVTKCCVESRTRLRAVLTGALALKHRIEEATWPAEREEALRVMKAVSTAVRDVPGARDAILVALNEQENP